MKNFKFSKNPRTVSVLGFGKKMDVKSQITYSY